MAEHPIQGLMATAMQKIKEMVDVNTVIGEPITTNDGTVILPVSKVSLGFAAGGTDFPSTQKDIFGGGSGAGISLHPVAFLVVNSVGDVRLLELANGKNTADKVVNMMPDLVDKVSALFHKDKKEPPEDEQ